MDIAKIKKKRTVVRSSTTKLLNNIEELILNNDITDLEELVSQLYVKQANLKELDVEIENLTDVNEVENEILTSIEYQEKITKWLFKSDKLLKEKQKTETNLSNISEQTFECIKNDSKAQFNVKLPKLEINKFYGNPQEWQVFFNSFDTTINKNPNLTKIDKFNYLLSLLGGLALKAVQGFSLSEQNYDEAISLLCDRFGRKDLLINSHMDKLLNLKPVKRINDLNALRKLYDTCDVQIRSLNSLNVESKTFENLLCPLLIKCIPEEIALSYIKTKTREDWCLVELMQFFEKELISRERAYSLGIIGDSFSEQKYSTARKQSFSPKGASTSKNVNIVQQPESKFCLFCDSNSHRSKECNLNVTQRKEVLKRKGKCFSCLASNHIQRLCKNKQKCNCGWFHNNLICDRDIDKSQINDKNEHVITANISTDHLLNLKNLKVNKKQNVNDLPIIKVECGEVELNAVVDSGTMIPVIKSSCVPVRFTEPSGNIILQSAFGHKIKAPLVNLPIAKCSSLHETYTPIVLTCAMVDNLVHDLLLSISAYNDLINVCAKTEINDCCHLNACSENISVNNLKENENIMGEIISENKPTENTCINEISENNSELFNVCKVIDNIVEPNSIYPESDCLNSNLSDSEKFRVQQKDDDSLANCWDNANKNLNGFFTQDNFLYHRDKVLNEPVSQLVIPRDRRPQLLELAHSSVWGGHLRKKKTVERLRYSFFWPSMKKDVEIFCNNCVSCQLQAKKRPSDEIPITPVVRPDEPFQIVNMDLIGPIEPSSSGYKYVLNVIDQCTRWPESICLKNLTAKSTCDALLQIFTRTGIPKVIASDQGRNFTAGLTEEFTKRIGSSPRFSVPGYPQSNGLVERWNGVLKNMIHHVMRENPSDWHKHIPFLLWAYREVPNETTGVSPFQMLYGRRPSGPLSILKSSWTNEIPVPLGQSASVTKYLNDLKTKLELAAEHAGVTCASKQAAYAFYHNRRKKYKDFEVGDNVIVLAPDSTHKMYARWTAPCTIIRKQSAHSYMVQMPDNSVKHIHANKIRKFNAQTANIGVIYETDIDFGDIENTPMPEHTVIDTKFLEKHLNISHLSQSKKSTLVHLLLKRPSLMSEKPKIANVGQHTIKLKSNSKPKRQYPYRIPEILKEEVDRQIDSLLELGLIEPSESDYAHPVVCVSKKDGTLRLCVDYRFLNSQTESDAFPMTNATDLVYRVASSKFITLLDLLKGYWQIRMDPESKPLTSFVTHRGQYSFNVMPFGLKNAAATFQRTMNSILTKHRSYAEAYIDDIVIFSNNWSDHIKHLDAVLEELHKANFTVKLKKCSFAQPKINLLGHIAGSGNHAPDPEKILAIKNLLPPTTKKDVRSLIGLMSYYRSYVKDFAEIARPLTELTKGKAPNKVQWLDSHEKAFEKLKTAICEAPSCFSPDFSKPFIIFTDASSFAVGACLAQNDEFGNERPIAFASKKLTKSQEIYATIEKEAFAIIFALKKFETYIFGAEVQIVCDHDPLTFLRECSPQSARLQRWSLALERFNARVSYRRGKANLNADSLSRLPAIHWTDE